MSLWIVDVGVVDVAEHVVKGICTQRPQPEEYQITAVRRPHTAASSREMTALSTERLGGDTRPVSSAPCVLVSAWCWSCIVLDNRYLCLYLLITLIFIIIIISSSSNITSLFLLQRASTVLIIPWLYYLTLDTDCEPDPNLTFET